MLAGPTGPLVRTVVASTWSSTRPESRIYRSWYSDTFNNRFKAAGLPVYRLHDARHTSVTLMILNGVPIPVVSAWHGHATPAFTMAFYAHSQDDALARAGERLADVYGSAQGRL